MGLKDAGIPARDYTNNRKTIMCKLYENGLVYNANAFDEAGRTIQSWTTSEPLSIGDYVELHDDSTAEHIIVKKAGDGSKKIIGKVIFDPRVRWTPNWTSKEKNRLPRENKDWGEYSPRSATVEFFGDAIDYIELVEENSAIKPYDNIVYKKDNAFDKAGNNKTTNLLSLAKVDALKSGKLVVLEGYKFYGAE